MEYNIIEYNLKKEKKTLDNIMRLKKKRYHGFELSTIHVSAREIGL